MKTVRKLIHGEITRAVLWVAVGFLALFVLFDGLEELQSLSNYAQAGYRIEHAALVILLNIPGHLYELLPISVLIGAIFVMARFAQSSEFTILRTAGLNPAQALSLLMKLGLVFVCVTFVVGDYLSPQADQAARLVKARHQGRLLAGQTTGAWIKDKQESFNYSVNVRAINGQGDLVGVRIIGYDAQGRLVRELSAQHAVPQTDLSHWALFQGQERVFHTSKQSDKAAHIVFRNFDQLQWPTTLTTEMVAAALLSPDRMQTLALFQYMRHLSANGQSSQKYEIEFWRKVFYPLSCLVMMVLALPFGYLHFRSGQISIYVFGGVLAGISFYLLNNLFGFVGNLNNWQPWLASASPALLYSLISLAAFTWLVRRQ